MVQKSVPIFQCLLQSVIRKHIITLESLIEIKRNIFKIKKHFHISLPLILFRKAIISLRRGATVYFMKGGLKIS